MNLLQMFCIRWQAKQDAKAGVYQCESRITSLIGSRPAWDTEQYADQGFIQDDSQEEAIVREHNESILLPTGVGAEDAVPPPRIILTVGTLFFVAVGSIAGTQLMKIMGFAPGQRVVLGTALECLVIVLTAQVARIAREPKQMTWVSAITLLVYVAFLLSAAALRLSDVMTGNRNVTFLDVAASVLLVFATAGPAWMAELCLRLLFHGAPAARRNRVFNTLRRRSEDRARDGRAALTRIGGRQRLWDEDFARLKAAYDTTYYMEDATLRGDKESEAGGRDGLRIVSSGGED